MSDDNTSAHALRGHALCSASSATRWINCPGSVGLGLEHPQPETSSYAIEGTKAHEAAESVLLAWIKGENKPIKCEDLNMVEHVKTYIDCVKRKSQNFDERPNIRIETQLILNQQLKMFGTADIAMTGKLNGVWHGKIVDLKYGKVKVQAEENPQLGYYAAALWATSNNPLESVEVTIVQPRIKAAITSVTYKAIELELWYTLLVRAAENGYRQTLFKSEREFKRGSWCKYCNAKKTCPEFNKLAEPGEGLEFI